MITEGESLNFSKFTSHDSVCAYTFKWVYSPSTHTPSDLLFQQNFEPWSLDVLSSHLAVSSLGHIQQTWSTFFLTCSISYLGQIIALALVVPASCSEVIRFTPVFLQIHYWGPELRSVSLPGPLSRWDRRYLSLYPWIFLFSRCSSMAQCIHTCPFSNPVSWHRWD